MIRERLKELRGSEPTPATVTEFAELATQAGDDVALASLALLSVGLIAWIFVKRQPG